ncbi:MAG TPA: type II toxin-antitoxin system VapC family toxin [Polyangiales bacterium]|nr:type II toxin-antitoxin system VapC family toxin [Polyangiales bacterium]
MIIADTDVLVDFLRGGGAAARVELELSTGSLRTTVVAAFELWQGARSARAEQDVKTLLEAVEILPLDARAAELAGGVRRLLLARGSDIGVADSLVAGICLRQDGTLLTRNREHFSRVSGLRVSGST